MEKERSPEDVLQGCADMLGSKMRQAIVRKESWLTLGPHGRLASKRKWDADEIAFMRALVGIRYFVPKEHWRSIKEIIVPLDSTYSCCECFLGKEDSFGLFEALNNWVVRASADTRDNTLVLKRLPTNPGASYYTAVQNTPAGHEVQCYWNGVYKVGLTLDSYTKLVDIVSSPMQYDSNGLMLTAKIDNEFFPQIAEGEQK